LGLIMVLGVLLALTPLAAPAGRYTAAAASAASLQEKLQDNKAQLEKIRQNIAKAEAARKAALGDIAALDQNIDVAEKELRIATAAYDEAAAKLAALRAELDAVTVRLNQKRDELQRTEADLHTQQQVFNQRMANIYKSGGRMMFLAALLDPGSITDLMGRFDLLSDIAEQDSELLIRIEELKVEVEDQKAALEVERAAVSQLEQAQRATTEALDVQADKKKAAVDELEEARAAKEKVLAAAEKDKASWSRQEDELSAESERIAAQLKAAQQAATVQASGGGGGGGRLYRPVPGAITSPYGYRIHPIFHVRKMHTGVDMTAGMGTPIHAAEAGSVLSAGWRGGYGKCVVISHGGGLATLYGHLSSISVSAGQKVGRGEVIGKVGSTGYSTGPHLHFEVRVNGSPVNPAGYL
jgi:murein DD-endopeptidase MepM/ murein hydrolase activator NlpD